MASNIPTEAVYIHNALALHLRKHIVGTELQDLKRLFRDDPLTPLDIDSINDIYGLFDCLMRVEKIDVGNYHQLVQKLQQINPNLVGYVKDKEREIKRIIERAASLQPKNLHAVPLSSNRIEVTWDPPENRQSVISYKLYFNDSYRRLNDHITIDPPVTNFRLTDLTPNTLYYIQLSAVSTKGEGARTPTIQVQTQQFGQRFPIEEREIKARMELPMVRAVLDTGMNRNVVMQAIRNRLEDIGDDFPNAEALMNSALEINEDPEQFSAVTSRRSGSRSRSPSSETVATPTEATGYFADAEMRDLFCRGDVGKLKARINDGLDLSTWRDINGNNIYHYCICSDVSFEILCVAEAVPNLCHTHASLLQERGYQSTPVLQACKMSVDANKYNLAVLEIFLRHGRDINYETLFRSSGNMMIHKFLTWRQKYQAGLPKELARLPNQYILSFIEAIEEMDISTAQQYMTSIQDQAELSRNIRIVILGYQGVGKTTLLLRLTGQDLASLKSTDQIDIHQNLVIVDQDLNKYWLIPKELEHDVARSRLQNILTDSMTSHQRKANTVNRSMGEEAEEMNIFVEPSKTEHDDGKEVIYEHDMTLPRSQDVLTDDSASVEKDPETSLKSEAGAAMLATNMTSLGSAKSKAYVSIFDFGGEIMFSNFQHIFLNTNNVVLLCFSLHKIFEEDKILERIYFWLNFLSTFAVEDKMYCPPVVLVGTHLDKVPKSDQGEIKSRVETLLLEDEKHAAAFQRHVIAFEVVANGEDGIKDIRIISDQCQEIINVRQNNLLWKQICAAAVHQSLWNQPLPAKWILLERDLMIMKGQGKKVVTLKEIKDRAKQLSVPLEDDDVTAMLRYLHGNRSILCFKLDNPDDEVVLDIKFIIDAFRMVVTDLKFHKRKRHVDPSLQKEYGSPRLTMKFVRAVWSPGSEFHPFIETLLFYLERLELIVRPLPNDSKKIVDFYIVPYLLNEADPSHIREMLTGVIKSSTLCFDFLGRFIPPPVYNKILASCIHRFKLFADEEGKREKYLQQGLACFVLSPRWNLIVHCKDSSMKITLFSNIADTINAGDGHSVRCILEDIVKSTLERNSQEHIKFQYLLSNNFEVTWNEEMIKVELPIQASSQVDAEIAVWCRPEQNQVPPANFPSDNLDKCLTTKEMSHVANYIGADYCLLFYKLKLSSNEIQQVAWACRDCLRTLVTRLLVKWNNKLGEKAVLRLLLSAMNSEGFNTDEVIKHLHEMAEPCNPLSTSTDVDRCPTELERLRIAKKIGLSYVIFFLELDMDIETIDQSKMNYPDCLERFTNLLKRWVNKYEENATFAKIYMAAKESSMEWQNLQREIQDLQDLRR